MSFYEKVLRPLLFQLEPERAHHLAIHWLAVTPPALLRLVFAPSLPRCEKTVFGVYFPNPVGLAAGMDKNAEALPAWAALGFGYVEAGTITALAQPGNPPPRLFRYPKHRALINRMGFNNRGAEEVARRMRDLKATGRWPQIPVGFNIGKSRAVSNEEAASDYRKSFVTLAPFADYIAVNVSSPNTPGLRQLQEIPKLRKILQGLREAGPQIPLLVKIAPDLSDTEALQIAEMAEEIGLAGIIATNTTLDHSALAGCQDQEGGLSGEPLAARSTELVRLLSSKSRLPIVASGGVMDAASAAAQWRAGASLLQVYTGLVYRGPGLIREILSTCSPE